MRSSSSLSRTSATRSSAPRLSARSTFSRLPVDRLSSTVTRSPRSSSASTRFEPMKPAPPVTRQSMAAVELSPLPGREPCEDQFLKMAGPHRTLRRGPGRRTTLVGLGGRPQVREKGGNARGPEDFRVTLSIPRRNLNRTHQSAPSFGLASQSRNQTAAFSFLVMSSPRRGKPSSLRVDTYSTMSTEPSLQTQLLPSPSTSTVPVLGVPLALTDYERMLDWIDDMVYERHQGYVCVCNVHTVMASAEDPGLRAAVLGSSVNVPDGPPL